MSQSGPATEPKIDDLSDEAALNEIGHFIDVAYDTHSAPATERAFALLDELNSRNLAPENAVLIHYYRANAWENRQLAEGHHQSWKWEQADAQQQILELRRAVTHEGFTQLDAIRQCQILTNLANQLDTMGRFIEAIELWDRALTLNSKFGMALGNRGRGLTSYANALYDPGHAIQLRAAAHEAFCAAAANDALYENPNYGPARSEFEALRQKLATHVDVSKAAKLRERSFSLGKSASENRYRMWCLQNRLVINPLNDLGVFSIAARDVLSLPSITESSPSPHPPAVFGFFNQMKQEFVSARHFYYEGMHAKGVHFSDRDVLLFNTLDYPAYSLATEKVRTAFRLAYSLFDKVAFFVNVYFAVGHNPKQVSFRSVWYEAKGSPPRPLVKQFAACENWPLRGLFWLSKDLFDEDFQDCTEPDAAALNEVRNHLEHKYLQLHLDLGASMLASRAPDALGYRLSTEDFAAKALRLLKLTRAALIYLSLAVHREERLREKAKPGGIVVPMHVGAWDDDWKRHDL